MDTPVATPVITNVLIDKVHADNEAAGAKEKAFPTMFRYSDAGKCARQMAFSYLGYDKTEPVDLAGEWVMFIGTLMHEKLQEALEEDAKEQGGTVEIEGKTRIGDLASGHFDALIFAPNGEIVLYELKTMGAYGWDLSVGILRRQWKRADPQGPRVGAKIQAALNALAAGADTVVIGHVGFEALSKGFAEKIGATELDRIMGEWRYPKEVWEPWALAEIERLEEVKNQLDNSILPGRWGIDDDMAHVEYNASEKDYPCSYCPYRSLCQFAGPDMVALPIPGLKEIHAE